MKRPIVFLLLCAWLVFSVPLPARAESAAAGIQIYASIDTNGDAEVTTTVRIRLEETVSSLSYPLPLNATNITMNDSSVSGTKSAAATLINLGSAVSNYTGEFSVTFKYEIPDVVAMSDGQMVLSLPLLSGFQYPVERVSFTIMLPSSISSRPSFKSNYHQDSIETMLEYSVNGSQISGLINTVLNDQETLSMTLNVDERMFGGVSTYVREGNPEVVHMGIIAGLALLYWLLFLRCAPLLRVRRTTPPEGITAGELGTRLTLCGADLTGMVFSWAQLGYVLIQLDDNGRVILHKRMDMGNERSAFEGRVFRKLFGTRRYIDGTGAQYARLARTVARAVPGKRTLCRKNSGNPKICRFLAAGTQVFCGICLAMNITGVLALEVILAIALSVLGAVSAWVIQGGVYRLHLRYKVPLLWALGCIAAWMLLGILAGQWGIALASVLVQVACGFAVAYGGRRTDLGRQNACQILGFRSYLKNVSREDLQRIQSNDPEYFFNALPFAMALGVEKSFAKRFGHKKLPPCPYFICGVTGRMTAEDWADFMHETAEILDERQRRMVWEKYAIVRVG